MRLLPLILSVAADPAGRQECSRQPIEQPCRFCGWAMPGWQGADVVTEPPSPPIAACVLCHLVRHLERPQIDQEAMLVWLPQISQAALVALVRRIHLVLIDHGEPAPMDRRPKRDDPPLVAAYSAYRAFQARGTALEGQLGTTRPSDVAATLLGFDPATYRRRAELLVGIRLLPLGRAFEAGEDIYPALLKPAPC
jgi:hypothetical protein